MGGDATQRQIFLPESNADNSCQKTRKIRYCIFEALSNSTVFPEHSPDTPPRTVAESPGKKELFPVCWTLVEISWHYLFTFGFFLSSAVRIIFLKPKIKFSITKTFYYFLCLLVFAFFSICTALRPCIKSLWNRYR